MDMEFHYWITGIVAHAAGLSQEDATILAYSSQYVDDNSIGIVAREDGGGGNFANLISQTINILKPRNRLMRIYPVFHFMPGDPQCPDARRRDGKMHLLNTTPDGEISRQLVKLAMESDPEIRLYRMGIAIHTHCDTWAHQNFVGWYDDVNAMGKITANIGHADAFFDPDIVNLSWPDYRLVALDVDNNARFLDAAGSTYDFLSGYTGRPSVDWNVLKGELSALMTSSKDEKERTRGYMQAAPWLASYDEFDWLNAAVKPGIPLLQKVNSGIILRLIRKRMLWRGRNYTGSHWYRFQVAVKDHCREALVLLKPVFEQMDVDISIS